MDKAVRGSGIKRYMEWCVRGMSASFLPVFYCTILYFLVARAWSGWGGPATVYVDYTASDTIFWWIVGLYSIYPLIWLCISFRRLAFCSGIPFATRLMHWFLFLGIVSAHVVTWMAVHAMQYDKSTFEMLLRYDLILFDMYAYWKSDRKGMVWGIYCLSILVWISSLYGICEYFLSDKVILLYSRSFTGRVCSVYSNPIISACAWLMGFWLPFPSDKKWVQVLVKCSYIAAIFLTLSKGEWIGLVLSIVLYLIWNRRYFSIRLDRKRLIYILSAFGGLLFLGLVFLVNNHSYMEFVVSRISGFQTQWSFVIRLRHIEDTLRHLIHEAPIPRLLFGYGNSLSRVFIQSTPHYAGITNIDNQYVISLFEFGIIGLLCMILWIFVCCRAGRKADNPWGKAAGMGITAMVIPIATFDPFQWEIIVFLLFLLTVVAITDQKIDPGKKEAIRFVRGGLCAAGCIALLVWIWLAAVSWCRTLYYCLLDQTDGLTVISLIYTIAGPLSACILFTLCAYLIWNWKKIKMKEIAIIVIMVAVFFVWFFSGGWIINSKEAEINQQIAKEQRLLDTIRRNAEGNVYEDRYPWFYQRADKKIKASVFNADSIIPEDSMTVLTAGTHNYEEFFERGYLLTYLSKDHALYTNDVPLIRALESEGLHMTAYYHAYGTNKPDPDSEVASSGYDIHRFYDVIGRLVREEYYSKEGERVENGNHFFTVTHEYDSKNRITEDAYYGTDGKKKLTRWEYASARTNYDDTERSCTTQYFGPLDEKLNISNGYHMVQKQYDQVGNVVHEYYFGVDEKPVLIGNGYAQVSRVYNDRNQVIRENYYGLEGEPADRSDKISSVEYKYDDDGNVIEQRYFGTDGKPVITTSGYAVVRRTFDDFHQIGSESYYGMGDEPILVKGYHAIEYIRNIDGDAIEQRYYNQNGQLALVSSGYAILRREFNDFHQITRESYYDMNDEPILISGYHSIEYVRNENGDAIEQKYYDLNGRMVLTSSGYAILRRKFNDLNQIVQESYYDTEDKPVLVGGCQTVGYERNELGDVVVYRYYDADGKPVLNTSGVAVLHRDYNDKRQGIRDEFFGVNDEPIQRTDGAHAVENVYDENGNVREARYFDKEGNPVMTTNGYSMLLREYNDARQIIRESYFDTEEAPIDRYGYHTVEYVRDSQGHAVEEKRYNKEGKLVDGTDGFAWVVRTYDAHGELAEEIRYHADGSLAE